MLARLKILLPTLIIALGLSIYMTFYTQTTPKKIEATQLIPYHELTPQELAYRYARALGDEISDMAYVVRRDYCEVYGFETVAGNGVEVGYCGDDFRYLTFMSELGVQARLQTVEDFMMYVLARMGVVSSTGIDLLVSVGAGPDGLESLRGVQKVGGLVIGGSGFHLLRKPAGGLLKAITIHQLYGISGGTALPGPNFSRLLKIISEDGMSYQEPHVKSLRVCGRRLAYNVFVRSANSPAVGYNAVIDIYDGEILSLLSLSPIGSQKIVPTKCL